MCSSIWSAPRIPSSKFGFLLKRPTISLRPIKARTLLPRWIASFKSWNSNYENTKRNLQATGGDRPVISKQWKNEFCVPLRMTGLAVACERYLEMKFCDFVKPETIVADLAATDKQGVIRELVDSLVEHGRIKTAEKDSIFEAIMTREELGSTGIGRGVAVPHTKHPSVDQLIGTVGVSSSGVDFQSLDGEKVQLVFLLVSPPDRPGDHLRALENISRQLHDETFCRFLKQSKTAAEIQQVLEEADNNQYVS